MSEHKALESPARHTGHLNIHNTFTSSLSGEVPFRNGCGSRPISFPPSAFRQLMQELLRGPKTFAGKGNVREVYIAEYEGRGVALKLLINKSVAAMHEHWVELVTTDAVSVVGGNGHQWIFVRFLARLYSSDNCDLVRALRNCLAPCFEHLSLSHGTRTNANSNDCDTSANVNGRCRENHTWSTCWGSAARRWSRRYSPRMRRKLHGKRKRHKSHSR